MEEFRGGLGRQWLTQEDNKGLGGSHHAAKSSAYFLLHQHPLMNRRPSLNHSHSSHKQHNATLKESPSAPRRLSNFEAPTHGRTATFRHSILPRRPSVPYILSDSSENFLLHPSNSGVCAVGWSITRLSPVFRGSPPCIVSSYPRVGILPSGTGLCPRQKVTMMPR